MVGIAMIERFQGTDGVRKLLLPSSDERVVSLTPQEAFVQAEVMTEQFFEIYLYARATQIIDNGLAKAGDTFTIGWDPRDPEGFFTGAAISGIQKAGLNVDSLGIIPTPGVPLFIAESGSVGGAVITASHNPASYNGIKLFTRRGLKLLPGDDFALTKKIVETDYSKLKILPEKGLLREKHNKAVDAFVKFHLDRRNSWVDDKETLKSITLIVDCANGAMTETAPKILAEIGFGQVIACNTKQDGISINRRCGVADLEGVHAVTAEMVEPSGRFAGYEALENLFCVGRGRATNELTIGAIFDGDGDRLFLLVYNPSTDSCELLTGDETALLQASRFADSGAIFANTVESDLAASICAADKKLETVLTGVGDKWILLTGFLALAQKSLSSNLYAAIEQEARSARPCADMIEALLDEAEVDITVKDGQKYFAVGAEESGHTITLGYASNQTPVMAGNGLKSLLNVIATSPGGMPSSPYRAGFKKTFYVYYVNKNLFSHDSELWNILATLIGKGVAHHLSDLIIETTDFPEEPDMLYFKLMLEERHVASLFIRASGTEEKIGITLRGGKDMADAMTAVGATAQKGLIGTMKRDDSPFALAEAATIIARMDGNDATAETGLDDESRRQLHLEMYKQGFATSPDANAELTPLGRWYGDTVKATKRSN